jgi:hypothetical protein
MWLSIARGTKNTCMYVACMHVRMYVDRRTSIRIHANNYAYTYKSKKFQIRSKVIVDCTGHSKSFVKFTDGREPGYQVRNMCAYTHLYVDQCVLITQTTANLCQVYWWSRAGLPGQEICSNMHMCMWTSVCWLHRPQQTSVKFTDDQGPGYLIKKYVRIFICVCM